MKKVISISMILLAFLSTFAMFAPQVKATSTVATLPAPAWYAAGPWEDSNTFLLSIDMDATKPGDQQEVTVSPGTTITFTYTFQTYGSTSGEIDQLWFAYSWASSWPPWDAYTPIYDSIPGLYPGVTITDSRSVTVPSTPGVYSVWLCTEAHYSMEQAVAQLTEQPTMLPHAIIVVGAPAYITDDTNDWIGGTGLDYMDITSARIVNIDYWTVRFEMTVAGDIPEDPSPKFIGYVWGLDMDRDGIFSEFPPYAPDYTDLNVRVAFDPSWGWQGYIDGKPGPYIVYTSFSIEANTVSFTLSLSLMYNPKSFVWQAGTVGSVEGTNLPHDLAPNHGLPRASWSRNLVKNPDFEQQLEYWSTSMGTATFTADTSNPHGGSYSAKGVELYEGSLGRLYQDMTGIVNAGGEYQISGWIRTQDVVGYIVIALDYVDDFGVTPADGYVMEIGYVTGTTDWTYYESPVFTLPPMPSDASGVWFLFDFNNGKGTAWWDDVSLIEVTPPPPPEDVVLAKKYFPVYKFSAGEEWYPCSFYFDENGENWEDLYNKENYDSYTPFPPPYYAYVHTVENATHKTIQYWLYYVWNHHGRWPDHYSDWDSTVFVILEKTDGDPVPVEVYYFFHWSKEYLSWNDWPEKEGTTHPVVYVAEGSHGAYSSPDEMIDNWRNLRVDDVWEPGGTILREGDFHWYLVGDSIGHAHGYSGNMYGDMTVEWIEGEPQWEFDSYWWPRKFPSYEPSYTMDPPWHRSDWMNVQPESAGILSISGFSPINLLVTDPDGLRVGYDSQLGESVFEIPGAIYSGPGTEPQIIVVPNPIQGVYVIDIFGTGNGTYMLTIQSVAADGSVDTQTYTGETVEGAVYVYTVSIIDEVMASSPDPTAELEHLREFIMNLPDDVFVTDDPDEFVEFKKEMFDKIDETLEELDENKYMEAIEKLNDMKEEVIDEEKLQPTTQSDLCVIIDHIISSIETLP